MSVTSSKGLFVRENKRSLQGANKSLSITGPLHIDTGRNRRKIQALTELYLSIYLFLNFTEGHCPSLHSFNSCDDDRKLFVRIEKFILQCRTMEALAWLKYNGFSLVLPNELVSDSATRLGAITLKISV